MNIFKICRMLGVLSAANIILVIVRCIYSQNVIGIYLVWNLILAAIPLCLAVVLSITQYHRAMQIVLASAWLLFLPNAPYIITDLIHLKEFHSKIWFQIFIHFSFAVNGILFGGMSLILLYDRYLSRQSNVVRHATIFVVGGLCGYGVYIGRFLRWNSWSIATHPLDVLHESAVHLYNTPYAMRTWAFVLSMSAAVWLSMYAYLQFADAIRTTRDSYPK